MAILVLLRDEYIVILPYELLLFYYIFEGTGCAY